MANVAPAAPLLYTANQWGVVLGLLAVGLAVKAWILWWLYRDTRARGADPTWWMVAAVPPAVDLVVLVVWLTVRPAVWSRNRPPPTEAAPAPAPPAPPPDPYRVPFQPAPVPTPSAAPTPPDAVRVTCPTCQNRFVVARDPAGPTMVRCDQCGATGRI